MKYIFLLLAIFLFSACALPDPVYVRSINHNVAIVDGKSYLIETPILASDGRGTFVGEPKFYDIKEKMTEQKEKKKSEATLSVYDQAEAECGLLIRKKGGPFLTKKEAKDFIDCIREKLTAKQSD